MSLKKSKLNQIINPLCKSKDEDYKAFIKKMMLSMNEGDKWGKLSELNVLAEKLKNKKSQK